MLIATELLLSEQVHKRAELLAVLGHTPNSFCFSYFSVTGTGV
jgi:hypothetical protein